MKSMPPMDMPIANPSLEYGLWIWCVVAALCAAYVGYRHLAADDRERTVGANIQNLGWTLYTLYTGLFGLGLHWWLHRQASPGLPTPFQSVWRQAALATVHCTAGQLSGMLLVAVLASPLHLPILLEFGAEYVGGVSIGLFVFKALSMRTRAAGSYWRSARASWLGEVLAMNAMMAGMIPVMTWLMALDMRVMDPGSIYFWGTMSLASVAGTITTYPLLAWLLSKPPDAPPRRRAVALFLTLAALAAAVFFSRPIPH